ncbi:MAG: ATP-binding protein [Taibaiella sp.]|nr:ATP-binding protein [Taibaiella sp.]
MILPIPNRTPNEIGTTIYKLIQLSQIVNNSQDEEIIVDFTNTDFLHCIFISGLFCLIKTWRANGKTVKVIMGDSPISSYFSTIQFENGFDIVRDPELINSLPEYNSKRYTPLVVFPLTGNTREYCVSTVLDVIHNQTNIKGTFKMAVDYMVSELTNNIADHSEAGFGVIFAQTYVNKGYIDISIVDNGIGVFNSYQKSEVFNPKDEAEAIAMAVNGRSTKDLPESRGFGISTSKAIIVKALGGIFLMWSGQTIFIETRESPNILKVDEGASYKGCFLSLRLPLNSQNNFNLYDFIG